MFGFVSSMFVICFLYDSLYASEGGNKHSNIVNIYNLKRKIFIF